MIKNALFAGLILACSTSAMAQYEEPRNVDFEISSPYKVVDATSKHYFHDGEDVYSIKIVKEKAILQHFDTKTMKETNRKELDLPKSYSLEGIYEIGGKHIVFYSQYEKSRKSEQLFARELNLKTAKWKGAQKKLISTRGKVTGTPIRTAASSILFGSLVPMGYTDKFDFYFSADDSKMMVQYRMIPDVKNDAKSYDEIGIHVFNTDLRELYGDVEKMPYTEKKMNIIDYAVDNDGEAYILTTVFNDNTTRTTKKGSKDDPNYHIELFTISPKAKKIKISEPRLQDKFISGVWLYETVDNKMVIAGFYNNTASNGDAEGVFSAKIHKDGSTYDEQTFAIPIEILNQYESKRTRKRNNKKEDDDKAEFQNLVLRKLQFMEDGSIVLIGEQYYMVQHTSTSNGRTSTYYTYHYNDMLITKIDPDGQLAWMRKLPKNQVGTSGRGSMSFTHHYDSGNHYLLFLDNEENKELPFDEAPETYADGKDGHLTTFIVDDTNGEVDKELILDMRDAKGIRLYQFTPAKILKISQNEFVFEAYKKKKEDVLVKIRLGS